MGKWLKITMSLFVFIIILILLFFAVQLLPFAGLIITIYGVILMAAGSYKKDMEHVLIGLFLMIIGAIIIFAGFALISNLKDLGVQEYLQSFFSINEK